MSDNPPFPGMHDAAASVAGGSLRAMEGDPPRGCRACLPPGWRPASRAARACVRLLHLQRPGTGDRACAPGRVAGAVHRPRRPSRRRGPGAVLGRPWCADVLDARERSVPVPRHRRSRRGRGRRRRGYLCQRPAPAGDRGSGVGGHPGDIAPRIGRLVRAGPDRVATRGGLACLGSARASERHDDGPRTGGAAGRSARASVRTWSMARDRWRRLRRVPGGAPDLVPDLAGWGTSGGADIDAGGVARTVDGRGDTVRASAAPRDLR